VRIWTWAVGAITVVVIGSALGRTVGDGWAWTALVAFGFLAVYRQARVRAWLIVGCLLVGVAAAMLLGGFGVPGAFWFGLAAGALAIDAIEAGTTDRASKVGAFLGLVGLATATTELGWWADGRGALALGLTLVGAVLGRRSFRRPAESDR
jgi:hypothetical protein